MDGRARHRRQKEKAPHGVESQEVLLQALLVSPVSGVDALRCLHLEGEVVRTAELLRRLVAVALVVVAVAVTTTAH